MTFKDFDNVDKDKLLYPLIVLSNHMEESILNFQDVKFTDDEAVFYRDIEANLHQIYATSMGIAFLASALEQFFTPKSMEYYKGLEKRKENLN